MVVSYSYPFCNSHYQQDRDKTDSFQLLNGLRLLVVDDNADILDLVTFIFDEYHVQVRKAVSVDEAIKVIQEWKPDILISDVFLQGKDCYSLIRSIRIHEAQEGKFLPAIALTGYAFPEDRTQALNAGFQIYISKPFDPNKLVAVVGKLNERILLGTSSITQNAA